MTLHSQFMALAKDKQKILYKLLALLPEIYASREYLKYAHTIQGYAFRFAQIPESVVNKTLRLHKKIKDKPILKEAISEVGVHKVDLVANLVTNENEEVLVQKVKSMSKNALQELSKELRGKESPVQTETITISCKLMARIKLMKKKLKTNSIEETLSKLLDLVNEKETKNVSSRKAETRYVPVKKKREVVVEYAEVCAYPNCEKRSEHLHHQDRFAETRSHEKIVPLCKVHHEFAHNSLIKNESLHPSSWQFQLAKTTNLTDLKYQRFRS